MASKLEARFDALGVLGLEDASRAPRVVPHKTPPELVELIVAERAAHPSDGFFSSLIDRDGARLTGAWHPEIAEHGHGHGHGSSACDRLVRRCTAWPADLE